MLCKPSKWQMVSGVCFSIRMITVCECKRWKHTHNRIMGKPTWVQWTTKKLTGFMWTNTCAHCKDAVCVCFAVALVSPSLFVWANRVEMMKWFHRNWFSWGGIQICIYGSFARFSFAHTFLNTCFIYVAVIQLPFCPFPFPSSFIAYNY